MWGLNIRKNTGSSLVSTPGIPPLHILKKTFKGFEGGRGDPGWKRDLSQKSFAPYNQSRSLLGAPRKRRKDIEQRCIYFCDQLKWYRNILFSHEIFFCSVCLVWLVGHILIVVPYQFEFILAMCPWLGVARRWVVFFLMLWPDIIQFGRITSDVAMGMSVTQFLDRYPHS